MLAAETVLQNRYRIIRLLGQGGMGAVYEAMDERLDTAVALKETLFADERLRKQFEREARLLARMHHPALPRVSDHFAEGEGQFLVMQFIPGDDLSQMMTRKQGKPFPADQVLMWGDQLLDALDYLHTQDPQIIHRDIKPQNLKLTSRGQIILLDFGLAKGQAGGVSLVTTSASIFGYTPNYAPLEQIQGLGTDARSDIYALSATLYHLMTAVKPPDALSRAAALVNGQPDPLAPAHEVAADIGPEVAGVLARAMSQNRDQRYPTAAAMRAALNGTGEVATLVGRTEAATVLFDRPAATLASASASTAETASKTGETTVVRSPGETRKRRVAPWAIGAAAFVLIGVFFGGFYAYQRRSNSNAAMALSNSAEQRTESPANATPSPEVHQAATEPSSGSLTDVKKPIISNHPTPANQGKKNEKAGEKHANAGGVPDTPDPAELYPGVTTVPNIPDIVVPDISPRGKRGVRRLGGTTIRNLPDGTQVMTLPDGTRVVTRPDGTKRVFGPGERIPRRRVP
ncbi:MAG TPA: protein kinase [Pyrinomonadaceae bacterium]|jgi:serine/threonine protein kinase